MTGLRPVVRDGASYHKSGFLILGGGQPSCPLCQVEIPPLIFCNFRTVRDHSVFFMNYPALGILQQPTMNQDSTMGVLCPVLFYYLLLLWRMPCSIQLHF